MSERRARTRRLIELGGLLAKSGLVDLAGDDRPAILGALIECAEHLRDAGAQGAEIRTALLDRWRRAGRAAFEGGRTEGEG